MYIIHSDSNKVTLYNVQYVSVIDVSGKNSRFQYVCNAHNISI